MYFYNQMLQLLVFLKWAVIICSLLVWPVRLALELAKDATISS